MPEDSTQQPERRPSVDPDAVAEVQLHCDPLAPTLAFFVERLNFRIESIYPAEAPRVATLAGHGLRLRLSPEATDPGHIRLLCADSPPPDERVLVAPNGTRIDLVAADPPIDVPIFRPEFIVTRQADGPEEVEGRAGMIYRDLIPGRLGGRYIASHISIPDGGPVADWAHFHKIRFQMIFCARGWVRVVYEDQGPPFVLDAGDCVLQPPRIRHQVLESSPGLEVIEIGCPALHETIADHAISLPTGAMAPDRDFDGQVFLRHVAAETPWTAWGETGFDERATGMAAATRGLAEARVLRCANARGFSAPGHDGELSFGVVLEGRATLEHRASHALGAFDAFVVPPGEPWGLKDCSEDFRLLQVETAAALNPLSHREREGPARRVGG